MTRDQAIIAALIYGAIGAILTLFFGLCVVSVVRAGHAVAASTGPALVIVAMLALGAFGACAYSLHSAK